MIQAYSDITQKALKLSSSDRATLAQLLIQSLDSQSDEAVADAWRKEYKECFGKDADVNIFAGGDIAYRHNTYLNNDYKRIVAKKILYMFITTQIFI